MHVNEFGVKEKTEGANQSPISIWNTFNYFFDVLTNKFPKLLFLVMWWTDHKIELMLRLTLLSTIPYKLNKKLEKI